MLWNRSGWSMRNGKKLRCRNESVSSGSSNRTKYVSLLDHCVDGSGCVSPTNHQSFSGWNMNRNIFEPLPLIEDTEIDWQDVLLVELGSILFMFSFCILMFGCYILVYAEQHQFGKEKTRMYLQDMVDKVIP